jgi:ornithine decarboxylase
MTETPFYLFDLDKVILNYQYLNKEIRPDKLFYALKSNSELPILEILKINEANFEIATIGELVKLKEINVNTDNIICSTPVKKTQEIQLMYDNGVNYFVFDTISEYYKLVSHAVNAKKILRIFINDIQPCTLEFGANIDVLKSWMSSKLINPRNIDGITFYLSKNKDIEILLKVLDHCEHYLNIIGMNKILNIGGNYRVEDIYITKYYPFLRNKIKDLKEKYNCTIYAEPGRSVVKSSGSLFTSVVNTKKRDFCKYLYLDAGHPTGISYSPESISVINKNKENSICKYKFFDITCSHHLLFEKDLKYDIIENDILQLHDFGSYSICKSTNFHGWAKPNCIYIGGK